ncbi:MAG: methylenetetrahydrofolate reductase [Rhizobium sp.]|nr:methylenetetrahydrofolate reductase [Rhizobium sp.]
MIETADRQLAKSLFSNYALEITGKDIGQIAAARSEISPGTQINIAFLGNETHEQRIEAAAVIRRFGFEPVPIISSRRLKSREDRDALLSGYLRAARPRRFIFVGGDPAMPAGPYKDSLDLIASNIISNYQIRNVGIVGYPEGHPRIDNQKLWDALRRKIELLSAAGCTVEITMQFSFDADAIVEWIGQVREAGIEAPIRIGVPGPADVRRLLRFAAQFGVVSSAGSSRSTGFLSPTSWARRDPSSFLPNS